MTVMCVVVVVQCVLYCNGGGKGVRCIVQVIMRFCTKTKLNINDILAGGRVFVYLSPSSYKYDINILSMDCRCFFHILNCTVQ